MNETEKLLRRIGYYRSKQKYGKGNVKNPFPDLTIKTTYSLSNGFAKSGFKQSIDDHRWKRDREESKATIDAIERKKKSVAIAYNKGGYQYLPNKDDAKYIGKK
jgi:hypothetical protein